LGIRVGLSILSILVILAIGFSISPAYAGSPITDVWALYGKGPFTQPGSIGGGFLDATQNPAGGCTPNISCFTNVDTTDGTLINVGSLRSYHSVANDVTDPLIIITCFDGMPEPDVGSNFVFTFGGNSDDCIQNQRNAGDIGIGVNEDVVLPQNPNELQADEMVVADMSALISAGYTNIMFRLSSNGANHIAWAAVSDKGPSTDASVSESDLMLVPNPTGTDGIFPGDNDLGDDFNDVYINMPLKKFLYLQETNTPGAPPNDDSGLDYLLQQIKAEEPVIGGMGIQIDKTSLLLAGAQTNAYWILPIVVSAVIIGIITIRRK